MIAAADTSDNVGNDRASKITTAPVLTGSFSSNGVLLNWTPADPESSVGYQVFWGEESAAFSETENIGDELLTWHEITSLDAGKTYRFAVAAVDTNLNLSTLSNVVTGKLQQNAAAHEQETGLPPFGTFSGSGLDTINLENLNVNIRIPIVSRPGRGGGFSHAIVYDSSFWKRSESTWETSNWGWTLGAPVGSIQYTTTRYKCLGELYPPPLPSGHSMRYHDWAYVDPMGTVHKFDVDFYVLEWGECSSGGDRTGYVVDGTDYYLDATDYTQAKVIGMDIGSVDTTGRQVDRHGNVISQEAMSESVTHWKDTLGNVALVIEHDEIANTVTYRYPDDDGSRTASTMIVLHLTELAVNTTLGCTGDAITESVKLPTSLELPNGRQYTFSYEDAGGGAVTGRLARVDLPTGGYQTYEYPAGVDCTDGKPLGLRRKIYKSSTELEGTWEFERESIGSGQWETTAIAPQLPYDTESNHTVHRFGNEREVYRKVYQGEVDPANLVGEVLTGYSGVYPTSRTTILDDGKQSKIETDYGTYGNLEEIREYDWGTGTPGPLVRTKRLTYEDSVPYTDRGLTGLATSYELWGGAYDPEEEPELRVVTSYDQYSTPHPELQCITGAAQHDDTAYPCSLAVRGNPTTVETYWKDENGELTTTPQRRRMHFDSLGNLRKSEIETSGNWVQQQEWVYSATYQYAFPESVKVGPPSPNPQLTTQFTYSAYDGSLQSVEDPNEYVTLYEYDNYGRPDAVTLPNNAVVTTDYDDMNLTVTTNIPIQASDKRSERVYLDGLGRPWRVETRDTNQTPTVYSTVDAAFDPLGRPYRGSNPYRDSTVYWTETRFDALGRPKIIIPPNGSPTSNSTVLEYAGNTVKATDPVGRQHLQEFDALGRLAKVSEPDPDSTQNPQPLSLHTSYSYTVRDEIATVSQGAQTRTYVHDGLGRLLSTTTPEAGTVQFTYNDRNLVETRTDARNWVTTYGYDDLNRLTTMDYDQSHTPDVEYTYGDRDNPQGDSCSKCVGRLHRVYLGEAVAEKYTYDAGLPLVDEVRKTIDGESYVVQYDYNLAGQVTRLQYPSGRAIRYTYDSIGRPTGILDGPPAGASGTPFVAQDHPLVTVAIPSGVQDNDYYHPAGGLKYLKYGNSSNAVWGMFSYDEQTLQLSSLEYSDLLKLEYGYSQGGDNNGQIAEIENVFEPAASQQFTYDALHRLKTAAMGTINPSTGTIDTPQWGLEWDYDRYGNRELQQGTAGEPPQYAFSVSDTSNQTSSVTDVSEEVTTVGHDAAGNVIEQETTTTTDTYVFDAEGRLLSAAVAGRPTQTFLYDATGLRTMKTVDGEPSVSTAFVSVGAQVLAECATDDTEYLFFGGRPVAVYDAATQAITYLHYDHLSLRLVTDASGDLASENWHYPYGEQGAGNYTGANLFTSYERDDEEFDYAKFRYFAPHHGRFRSVDPRHGSPSNPQSLNRYAYAQNDPINLIDPLGLETKKKDQGHEPLDIGWTESVTSTLGGGGGIDAAEAARRMMNDLIALLSGLSSRNYLDTSMGLRGRLPGARGDGGGLQENEECGEPSELPEESSITLTECLEWCIRDQFGLTTVVGAGMWLAGQPWIPTRGKLYGATPGTSAASIVSRNLLPQKLPSQVFGTRVLGGVAGRAVPWVGVGLLVGDAAAIAGCTAACAL